VLICASEWEEKNVSGMECWGFGGGGDAVKWNEFYVLYINFLVMRWTRVGVRSL